MHRGSLARAVLPRGGRHPLVQAQPPPPAVCFGMGAHGTGRKRCPYIPVYGSALIVLDLVTAILLFGQFRFLATPAWPCWPAATSSPPADRRARPLVSRSVPAGRSARRRAPDHGLAGHVLAWRISHLACGLRLAQAAQAFRGGVARRRNRRWPRGGAGHQRRAHVDGHHRHDALPPIMRGNQYTSAIALIVTTTWAPSFLALIVLWLRRPHGSSSCG